MMIKVSILGHWNNYLNNEFKFTLSVTVALLLQNFDICFTEIITL